MAEGALKKILFIDRDGTLIVEPADHQIDAVAKFRLLPGVLSALSDLRDAGWRFVMVSNQDGLGGPGYPQERFDEIQRLLLDVLASESIQFDAVLICPHFEKDRCTCRKPQLGLVKGYLADPGWDRARSRVIGDRDTDLELARNMGIAGKKIESWKELARELLSEKRVGRVERRTKETEILAVVDLDGEGRAEVSTGIGFFDHMLEQISKHGGFDLTIRMKGDLHIDEHHTVEDVGLALGAALRQALGDKVGVGRYGFCLPMDETQAQAALDLSGRPFFKFEGTFPREAVGGLATEMVPHFFRSLSDALGATLHLSVHGENGHHMVEACFKVVGRSLRMAAQKGVYGGLPSTKGAL